MTSFGARAYLASLLPIWGSLGFAPSGVHGQSPWIGGLVAKLSDLSLAIIAKYLAALTLKICLNISSPQTESIHFVFLP